MGTTEGNNAPAIKFIGFTMLIITEVSASETTVRIEQHPDGWFRVSNGKDIIEPCDYKTAASEFGRCVLHSAALAGKLYDC